MDSSAPISPPPPPVPSRRSLIPIILVAGIAIGLGIVGIIGYQLLTRPGSAEDIARDFVVAAYEGDVARVCELGAPSLIEPVLEDFGAQDCEGLREAVAEDPTVVAGQEAADIELLESTEEGDTASVRLSAPSGRPGVWTQVDLERIDGQWLVTHYSG